MNTSIVNLFFHIRPLMQIVGAGISNDTGCRAACALRATSHFFKKMIDNYFIETKLDTNLPSANLDNAALYLERYINFFFFYVHVLCPNLGFIAQLTLHNDFCTFTAKLNKAVDKKDSGTFEVRRVFGEIIKKVIPLRKNLNDFNKLSETDQISNQFELEPLKILNDQQNLPLLARSLIIEILKGKDSNYPIILSYPECNFKLIGLKDNPKYPLILYKISTKSVNYSDSSLCLGKTAPTLELHLANCEDTTQMIKKCIPKKYSNNLSISLLTGFFYIECLLKEQAFSDFYSEDINSLIEAIKKIPRSHEIIKRVDSVIKQLEEINSKKSINNK